MQKNLQVKSLVIPLVLSLTLIVSCTSCTLLNRGAKEQWEIVFNGRDLSGWIVKCKPHDQHKTFWFVDNGTLLADSVGQPDHDYIWLMLDRELSDFSLRLQFQAYRDSPGNSGVQIRSRYDDAAGWLDGPQVDIHPPAPWRTGMIWDETRGNQRWLFPIVPPGTWVDESMAQPQRIFYYQDQNNAWNQLEISAVGMHLKAILNGVPIMSFNGDGILNDSTHRTRRVGESGYIALQIHTGDELKIRYRDILLWDRSRSSQGENYAIVCEL